MKLGCHVSMSAPDYVLGSVKEAISYGANAFMLYTGAPQNTRRKAMHELKIEEAHSLMKEHGIDEGSMIVHAPYIINLANCIREETFALGVEFLQKEIARVQALHATVLVLHPGSHVKAGEEEGLKKIVEGLDLAMQDVQDVQISIETMAGKGSEIGYSFAHIRYMMDHDFLARAYQGGARFKYVPADLAEFRLGGVSVAPISAKRYDIEHIVLNNGGGRWLAKFCYFYFWAFDCVKRLIICIFGIDMLKRMHYAKTNKG